MIFSMFFITHATFFTIIIIVIISLVVPFIHFHVFPFFTFSLHFFPKFYFLITWLVIYVLSYIFLLIVSKDVHTIAKIA